MTDILAEITRAADRGMPLRPRDLLRFDAAAVRALFSAADIVRAEVARGSTTETVILPACGVDERDDDWSADELEYLETAYRGGVSFREMARALKRPGSDILETAWRHKWQRRSREPDSWGSEIPAWRIARFRGILDEAERRGEMDGDDGDDLRGHRALWRRFLKGRAAAAGRDRHCHRWTDSEIQDLVDRYDRGDSLGRIARALRRTLYAVSSKLHELDMARCVSWTIDEDAIVAAGVGRGLTNRQISVMLPGRTEKAVKVRARQLCGPRGAELWTDEEKAALERAVAEGANLRAFAARIGRGVSGVRWQCNAMGLSHPRAVVPYRPSEDRRIREGWRRRERPAEIAADLGRPLSGIYNRAFKLGVTKGITSQRRPWRRFEIEYIRVRVAQGWPAKRIAGVLRRGTHAVYRVAHKNGIRYERRGPRPRSVAAEAAE